MVKTNWFPTLQEALDAENLSNAWPCLPIAYGQTIGLTHDYDNHTYHATTNGLAWANKV